MGQCHIQIVQPVSQWQRSAVTGYMISASITRTCKTDKTWSNVTPTYNINGTLALDWKKVLLQNNHIPCLQKVNKDFTISSD